MPDAAFRWGSFNGTVYNGYSNGYAGSRAWCHGTIDPMTLVQVDLSAYAGTPIQLRWIESDDTLIGFTGWYVDDVTVANAEISAWHPLWLQVLSPAMGAEGSAVKGIEPRSVNS